MLPFRDINPSRNFPLATTAIIVVNTLVFLYMVSVLMTGGEHALLSLVNRASVTPIEFTRHIDVPPATIHPIWVTIFTSMFMHGGPVHLLGNMLYLWIFGNNVEDIMGPFRYLVFYLLCGVVAALSQIYISPDSRIPMLGASGAIAGVLGAYLVRFPTAKVDTCLLLPFFFYIIRLPAIVVLAFWFLLQLVSGATGLLASQHGGGTAWWAHIGGFLAGMLLVLVLTRRGQQPTNRW